MITVAESDVDPASPGARRRAPRGRLRPDAVVADPDDTVVRIVMTAGREAVRSGDGAAGSRTVDGLSYRVVARALLGERAPERVLRRACEAFSADPDGMTRFSAMVRRAMAFHVTSESGSGEVLSVEIASTLLGVHAAMLRAAATRRAATDASYQRFAAAAVEVADADGYVDVCARAAAAVRELSGLGSGAIYVPGSEYARLMRAGVSGRGAGDPLPAPPTFLRIDDGLFADAIAGDRPLFLSSPEALEGLDAGGDVRTMVAVPMRDNLGRPAGLLVALDRDRRELDVDAVDALRRLGGVVEGALAAAHATRRSRDALATLPELAGIAASPDAEITMQLDALAAIVTRATGSDAAVVGVVDAAGRFLEMRAAASHDGEGIGDVIGGRVRLDDPGVDPAEVGLDELELIGIDAPPASWSSAGRRMLDLLGARSVACAPICSTYDRRGVLHVIRRTARAFDEADRASIRIVASHMQHVIDRHVSGLQTERATGAARSAIRLLGEALVAGVRTERSVRFVPRLYCEMFACNGCRTWRIDESGTTTLVASSGRMGDEKAADAVHRAAVSPLILELDTARRPHVAAVSVAEHGGSRLVIEFELAVERTLGQEEQLLAVEVAERIGETLKSAGQSAAQERQLARLQALQDVVALAHEQLSEEHVIATIADEIPMRLGASAAAVFLLDGGGQLEARAVRNVPRSLIEGVERSRRWVTDLALDDGASDAIVLVSSIAGDSRVEVLHDLLEEAGEADTGVVIVPITGREQTIGLLVMLFAGGLPEGMDSLRDMLRSFGRHAGSALVNAREHERERDARLRSQELLDEERESSRQVRALHEVSRTFAASLSLEETMRAVVEAMAHRLDVDAVWIRTPNERGNQLVLRAFYASQPEFSAALERIVHQPEQRDDAVNLNLWQTRQPVLVVGGEELDPRLQGSDALERLVPFLQRGSTLAVLPVAIPNEMLGTLTMLSIDPDHSLTHDKVDIAAGVTAQAALAIDNARLYQQQKNFAEVIQESLLPGRLPDMPGIELGVLYRSATAGGAEAPLIGGDFYDFLELEDGRLALAVGDVTGKGVGAAADTAMTKYIFRALAREHPSPASFLRYANDVVCEEITPGKFVTLFYAIIDPSTGTMTCGNAGHPEPKLVHPLSEGQHDPEIESISLEGLALGIMPDQEYEEGTFAFGDGCSLVVYTDGVVEARRDHKLYGQYRLERRLADEVGASAPQIAFAVYQDCAAYAEDGLGDDVAIVVAQRVDDPSAMP